LPVGVLVDALVRAGVRPDEDLETLKEAVGLLALREGVLDVARERSGLYAAEDREAQGGDVDRPAPDPVHVVRLVAVPRLQEECPISFMARPVQGREPPHKLVAVVEEAVGVVPEELSELLDGGVGGGVTLLRRPGGFRDLG
jgi:hypothetical protein